jgi:putative phage-type endonuclease
MINQNTQEWHQLRKTKIGASDAPVIMRVSPWKTPYQLWQEKLGLLPEKDNPFLNQFHDKEIIARNKFIEITGIEVSPLVVLSNEHPFMMASLDGISRLGNHIVEIKCPGIKDHECALNGKIPPKYYPQLQHQMIVCNLEKCFYFSYRSDTEYKLLEVNIDNEYNKTLLQEEYKFIDNLNSLTPPELMKRELKIKWMINVL